MAERRMFAKTIIDSDAFLEMPLSAQALYYHMGMRADDDGFINNPKKIQRMIGASDDDLKLLVAKRFILPFESGVVVIKHWLIHNYIRGDRKKATVYPKEMSLLIVKGNSAYKMREEEPAALLEDAKTETARQKAYRESTLPYSFEYKIRHAFYGKPCPVCGFAMEATVDDAGVGTDRRRPTIQHNKPLSKGGKHELGNISVICHHCNVSLQDTETGPLNADEVIQKWDEICMTGKCPSTDGQVTGKCPTEVRLGKDRLGKVSVGEENISGGGDILSLYNACARDVQDFFSRFFGRAATDYELEQIQEAIHNSHHTIGETLPEEFTYGDNDRELLQIAVESAAKANKTNVAYIVGCFRNFWQRGIRDGAQNEDYELGVRV